MAGALRPSLPRLALAVAVTAALLPVAQLHGPTAEAADSLGRACPAEQVPETAFVDIAENRHKDTINCLVWHQVARGVDADRYAPARTVTRDQMASFIARAIDDGIILPAPSSNFPDLGGNPHAASVNQLAELGIVQGTTYGTYAPRDAVSRAQMATFLVRAAERVTGSELPYAQSDFTDIEGNAHEINIAKAAHADLTTGTTATTFAPSAPVRRDQMASFVARMMEYLAGAEETYFDALRNGPKDPKPGNGYGRSSPGGEDSGGGVSEDEGDPSVDDGTSPGEDEGTSSDEGGNAAASHGADVDASNTGPTAFYADDLGRELTYEDLEPSGSITTSHDGQVVERKDIAGIVRIAHKDVTVRASRITNPDGSYSISYVTGSGATDAIVDHVEIDGTGNAERIGVHLANFTMTASEVYGHSTGVRFGSNSAIERTYVHDQQLQEGSHNTAMSIHGGSNVVVRNNNLEGSTSSALSLYPRTAPIENALVEGNLFNGGSYCTYAGYSKTYKDSNHDIRYLDNKFGRDLHDECGRYGPVTNWNPDQPGNEWTNNAWLDTGEPLQP